MKIHIRLGSQKLKISLMLWLIIFPWAEFSCIFRQRKNSELLHLLLNNHRKNKSRDFTEWNKCCDWFLGLRSFSARCKWSDSENFVHSARGVRKSAPEAVGNRGYLKHISCYLLNFHFKMREIVHIQAGQCGNQIGAKVRILVYMRTFSWLIFALVIAYLRPNTCSTDIMSVN